MNEIVILPEMLEAGMEAMAEAEHRRLEACDIVIAVYLAMRAVEEMAVLRSSGSVH